MVLPLESGTIRGLDTVSLLGAAVSAGTVSDASESVSKQK